MSDFKVRLKGFLNSNENPLSFPKSKALFKRETIKIFEGFKKHLEDKFMKHKGLTMTVLIRDLENLGYMVIREKVK